MKESLKSIDGIPGVSLRSTSTKYEFINTDQKLDNTVIPQWSVSHTTNFAHFVAKRFILKRFNLFLPY